MTKHFRSVAALIMLVLAILVLALVLIAKNDYKPIKYWFTQPRNFKECAEANGGQIMLSYPAKCAYGDKTFTDEVFPQQLNDSKDQSTPQPTNYSPQ